MLYARSDIHAFSGAPGCPSGGHTTTADPDHDMHFAVDCPDVCEPVLRADPLWAPRPREVPLTTDEQHQLDDQQDQAQRGSAELGLALMNLLRERQAGDPAPPVAQLPAADQSAPPLPAGQQPQV